MTRVNYIFVTILFFIKDVYIINDTAYNIPLYTISLLDYIKNSY